MMKLSALGFSVIVSAGILLSSGCTHPPTSAGGAPFPALKAPLSAPAQIQQIENDPHIPAAQKATIEAAIARANGIKTDKTPGQ